MKPAHFLVIVFGAFAGLLWYASWEQYRYEKSLSKTELARYQITLRAVEDSVPGDLIVTPTQVYAVTEGGGLGTRMSPIAPNLHANPFRLARKTVRVVKEGETDYPRIQMQWANGSQ